MKIKHGMILAAGHGKRMQPLTLEKPKPLLNIGQKSLLERAIELLINHGVEEIVINVHYLSEQITNFIKNKKYSIKITISDESDLLLGTGGGIFNSTKSFKKEPFFAINPDTLWNNSYLEETISLEKLYFKNKKPSLLLVDKDLSFDSSFKGDFNLSNNVVNKNQNNKYIFTGLQVLNREIFNYTKNKVFSMNMIWDNLITNESLFGIQSKKKFYHLNTKEMYDKISNLKFTD